MGRGTDFLAGKKEASNAHDVGRSGAYLKVSNWRHLISNSLSKQPHCLAGHKAGVLTEHFTQNSRNEYFFSLI